MTYMRFVIYLNAGAVGLKTGPGVKKLQEVTRKMCLGKNVCQIPQFITTDHPSIIAVFPALLVTIKIAIKIVIIIASKIALKIVILIALKNYVLIKKMSF